MSKLSLSDHAQNVQSSVFFSLNSPSLSNTQKQSGIEKRISDPSSTQPNGSSYPIPSSFEYRVTPKELDSL